MNINILNYVQINTKIPIVDINRHYTIKINTKPRVPERIFDINPELAKNR